MIGVCELAIQTQPEILVWAFTQTSRCKTWRLQDYTRPVRVTQRYACQNGIIHNSFSTEEAGDVNMTDVPHATSVRKPVDVHPTGDETETSQAQRSFPIGFDGNGSGIFKRIPRALAVESDEWVDYLDVRGSSEARYGANGDVEMWY